jgi:hypothetical protein
MLKKHLNQIAQLSTYAFLGAAIMACKNNKTQEKENALKSPHQQTYAPQVLKDTIGGVYHEYYKNGKIKVTGSLKDGKRDGDWSYFYENGKLWSWGEYTAGVRNGASSVYYENGRLRMEGNYFNNKQIGWWKFYNENGKLVKELEMK